MIPSIITSEMLQPLIDSVVSNVKIITPYCIILFGVILGVTIVPKLIKQFLGIGKN